MFSLRVEREDWGTRPVLQHFGWFHWRSFSILPNLCCWRELAHFHCGRVAGNRSSSLQFQKTSTATERNSQCSVWLLPDALSLGENEKRRTNLHPLWFWELFTGVSFPDLEQWWSQNLQGAWKLQRIKQFNGLHQGSLEYHKQPSRNEDIEIFVKGNESFMNGCKTSQEKDNS